MTNIKRPRPFVSFSFSFFFYFLFFPCFLLSAACGQAFNQSQVTIPNADTGCAAWADFAKDGYASFALGGSAGSSALGSFYKNLADGGFSLLTPQPFTGVFWCSMAVADANGDSYPDILISGNRIGSLSTTLYLNNGVGGGFTASQASFTGVYQSAAAWADYNSDGKPDLLICGATLSPTPFCGVYRQASGVTFTATSVSNLAGLSKAAVAWINVDGVRLGFIASGQNQLGVATSQYYIFDGGSFVAHTNPFVAIYSGSILVADFDNDGDQDVLITGASANGARVTNLYKNDGSGIFVLQTTNLPAAGPSSAAVGFFDGDNIIDIVLAGQTGSGTFISQVFLNSGSYTFTSPGVPPSLPLPNAAAIMTVATGDAFGTGKSSILIFGTTGSGVFLNTLGGTAPITQPPCYNGDYNPLSPTECICYEGFTGISCNMTICSQFRCLTAESYGLCVDDPVLCFNSTLQEPNAYALQPVGSFQASFDTRTNGSVAIYSYLSKQIRGKLFIPLNALQPKAGSSLVTFADAPITVITVTAVPLSDYNSTTTTGVPVSDVVTVVVDLSVPASVDSTFLSSVRLTLSFDPANQNGTTVGELCLAYLSANGWICQDSNLIYDTPTNTLSGLTNHFTSFGVLIQPSSNSGTDGGDGFDDVLIAPIVLSIFGAFVIVVVAMVVIAVVTYLIKRNRRQRLQGMGERHGSL